MKDILDISEIVDKKELQNQITKPTLIIAISPRTGSTALCSLLSKMRILGQIEEFFNPRGPLQHFSKDSEGSFKKYLESINQNYARDYFTFKTSWADFEFMSKNNLYKDIFPKARFIYLDRFDLNEQAISLLLSKKSGTWHVKKNEDWNVKSEVNENLNLEQALSTRHSLESEKRNWHSFFYQNDIPYLHMHYEFFSKDLNESVRKIMRYVGEEIDEEKLKTVESDYIKVEKPLYNHWLSEMNNYLGIK